ncbi:RNA-directed DNA polymerase, eukaryota [Tanacetum coccineum]
MEREILFPSYLYPKPTTEDNHGDNNDDGWQIANRRQNTKVYGTQHIITSYFFTEFPPGLSETALWKTFAKYGRITDVYMAKNPTINGKAFGFARFTNVQNLKSFETTLNSIVIGTHHLKVNIARFQRVDRGGVGESGGVVRLRVCVAWEYKTLSCFYGKEECLGGIIWRKFWRGASTPPTRRQQQPPSSAATTAASATNPTASAAPKQQRHSLIKGDVPLGLGFESCSPGPSGVCLFCEWLQAFNLGPSIFKNHLGLREAKSVRESVCLLDAQRGNFVCWEMVVEEGWGGKKKREKLFGVITEAMVGICAKLVPHGLFDHIAS